MRERTYRPVALALSITSVGLGITFWQLCLLIGVSLADVEGELLRTWQERQAPQSEGINSTTDTPRT